MKSLYIIKSSLLENHCDGCLECHLQKFTGHMCEEGFRLREELNELLGKHEYDKQEAA